MNQNLHAASNKRKKKSLTQTANKQRKTLLDANRYALLMNRTNENEVEDDNQSTSDTQRADSAKPAPITVTGTSANTVKEIMSECEVNTYTLKVISIGTKIILDSLSDYTKVASLLKTKKLNFFRTE